MTEPITDADQQNTGTAGAASILVNFFEALIEEGLALYRRLQDEEGIASALTDLGLVALWGPA